MNNTIVFDEVNQKIEKLQQRFTVRMDWVKPNSHGKTEEIVEIHTNKWQNADSIAKGAKFKAIEEMHPNSPSNSIIFCAPKGAVIDSHTHPQLEFCICLSGKINFITKKEGEYELEPIESIYVKPNDLHKIEFLEDSQIIVTWFPKMDL